MGFVYNRTIRITRVGFTKTTADGFHQGETLIAENVRASIQLSRSRPVNPVVTPGHTQSADTVPEWKIYFKGARDLVKKQDKIVDDVGGIYFVEAPYWNSFGWNITARDYHP